MKRQSDFSFSNSNFPKIFFNPLKKGGDSVRSLRSDSLIRLKQHTLDPFKRGGNDYESKKDGRSPGNLRVPEGLG